MYIYRHKCYADIIDVDDRWNVKNSGNRIRNLFHFYLHGILVCFVYSTVRSSFTICHCNHNLDIQPSWTEHLTTTPPSVHSSPVFAIPFAWLKSQSLNPNFWLTPFLECAGQRWPELPLAMYALPFFNEYPIIQFGTLQPGLRNI